MLLWEVQSQKQNFGVPYSNYDMLKKYEAEAAKHSQRQQRAGRNKTAGSNCGTKLDNIAFVNLCKRYKRFDKKAKSKRRSKWENIQND